MSAEESRKVVSRAVMEEDFRNQLFSDPDTALVGYDLTPEEINALRSIPAETIDEFANNLDERISMSLLYFGADLMGGEAMGGEARGSEAMGSEARGHETMGNEAMGNEVRGHETMGNETMGNEVRGYE
ncbi:MAG: Franean1_4349 family RiPP, partial [Anaerolineales bacterium]